MPEYPRTPFKKVSNVISPKVDGDSLDIPTGRCATLTVAANDSSALSKQQADYVCDGTDDDIEIQAAIDALPATSGKVVLMEGTFVTTSAIQMKSNVILSGQGKNSTVIQTSTNSINIIELHGTGTGDMMESVGVTDLRIRGTGDPTSHGLSLIYNKNSYFGNLIISSLVGYGIYIKVSWDNNWRHIYVEWCGGTTGSEPAVFLTDDGTGNTNNQKFFDLRIEPWRKQALKISSNTNKCRFYGLKCHGDSGTTNENAIEVDGNFNFFNDTFVGVIGSYTGFVINGTYNQIYKSVFSDGVGLCFDINSYQNIIDGVSAYGGVSKDITNGIDVGSNDCKISNVLMTYLDGWGITISSYYTQLSNISMILVDEQGLIITGNRNFLSNVSPSSCNQAGGFVGAEISSAFNTIMGGRFNPTIQLNNTANKNVIQGCSIVSDIIDNGYNNKHSSIYSDLFMDVLTVSATHIRSNEDLSAATPITFTLDAQPDVPRTLSWSFDTHAQITEYDMEVIGIDTKGASITETWDETAGWSGETSNAFATLTSIKMISRTGTGVADTMDIGITDVLGLSNVIYATSDVFKIKKNNANATVAAAQVNTTYDTYDMSVIGLGAGDDFTIWYKSNLNIIS